MPTFSSQTLFFSIVLILAYAILMGIVLVRQGLQSRMANAFNVYLLFALLWLVFTLQAGLGSLVPVVDWPRLGVYAMAGGGIFYWAFTRAFLKRKRPAYFRWGLAVLLLLLMVASDARLIPPAIISLQIGGLPVSAERLSPILSVVVSALFVTLAVGTAILEYVRRKTPLHRSRIIYWMLSTILLLLSIMLVISRQYTLELLGAALHWSAALLLTYVILNPQLPSIASGVRAFLNSVLSRLIPITMATVLSLSIVYGLAQSGIIQLEWTQNLFVGMVIGSIIVFAVSRPFVYASRWFLNRVLFGQHYETQQVVQAYSRAISQVISLEGVTAAAMELIDQTLGILRGTLLVIEEADEHRWWLRVMPGLGVPFGQPRLLLRADSPITAWFVERHEPLHQYTLDVDPRFENYNPKEVQGWRQLNMELFLPIKRSDQLIGVMALGMRRSGRTYTRADLDLLMTLADQTGIALENASLFYHAQRQADELALLNEIGREVTASIELDQVISRLAGRIEQAFKGSRGYIFLMDEAANELVLQNAFGGKVPKTKSFRIQPGKGFLGQVAEQGKSVLVTDLQADSRYDPDVDGLLTSKARATICAPIVARNRILGMILLVGSAHTSLGVGELSLLDKIASFAAVAVENAREVARREKAFRQQFKALAAKFDRLRRK